MLAPRPMCSPCLTAFAVAALAVTVTVTSGCRVFSRSPAPLQDQALATEGHGESESPAEAGADAVGDVDLDGGAGTASTDNAGEEPDLHADEDGPSDLGSGVPSSDRMPVASHYAGLDRSRCEAELERRHVSYERVGEARGVVAPLRLTGPLSGVTFRSNLPAAKAKTSPYDIYDCRLVLALDDFARTILSRHDIVEVIHLSVYRPVSSKIALKGPGRRHTGALAIDAAIFKTKDGRSLSVEKDFQPRRIGVRPCTSHEPKDATELRRIACEAADAQLFNVLLTPNFNWPHRNHYHMEVTANVKWTLVR